MGYSKTCPYCGKTTLSYFERTLTSDTLVCRECKAQFTVRSTWGNTQDLLLTILTFLTGIIGIVAFFGIRTIDDLRGG